MDDLEYYFDERKSGISEAYVKGVFQAMFKNKAQEIFQESINGGIGLNKCQQLFGTINPNVFINTIANDIKNPVYNFIITK